nr:hypothetical protein CFP56_26038 [Quercus suber]
MGVYFLESAECLRGRGNGQTLEMYASFRYVSGKMLKIRPGTRIFNVVVAGHVLRNECDLAGLTLTRQQQSSRETCHSCADPGHVSAAGRVCMTVTTQHSTHPSTTTFVDMAEVSTGSRSSTVPRSDSPDIQQSSHQQCMNTSLPMMVSHRVSDGTLLQGTMSTYATDNFGKRTADFCRHPNAILANCSDLAQCYGRSADMTSSVPASYPPYLSFGFPLYYSNDSCSSPAYIDAYPRLDVTGHARDLLQKVLTRSLHQRAVKSSSCQATSQGRYIETPEPEWSRKENRRSSQGGESRIVNSSGLRSC